jgi:hypothetical protein
MTVVSHSRVSRGRSRSSHLWRSGGVTRGSIRNMLEIADLRHKSHSANPLGKLAE